MAVAVNIVEYQDRIHALDHAHDAAIRNDLHVDVRDLAHPIDDS